MGEVTGFMECDTCRAKPGTPPLCAGCLHNRSVIGGLAGALAPSANTKHAYIGEFSFPSPGGRKRHVVPWDTIKEIMAAIRVYAEPVEATR